MKVSMDLKRKLENIGQLHLLRFWTELDSAEQKVLHDQLAAIDYELIGTLIQYVSGDMRKSNYPELGEANIISLEQRKELDSKMRPLGETMLREGKVAAFLVAGGQGTRLGFEGPKGKYPVTPVKRKSLFQLHAEKILAIARNYKTNIPWYIMTSESNDSETRSFFEEHDWFGFNREDVIFMVQDMIPALTPDGKMVLDKPGHVFTNPNGHGGSLQALYKSGSLAEMRQRGIELIFYFQVDNALTRICDPVFLGYHVAENSEMSNKVVRKLHAEEKMGVICTLNGKTGLIEYSDIRDEDMRARKADGGLKYWAGSIATHILTVDFVAGLNEKGFKLPFHQARKAIPSVTDDGSVKDIDGIKFETFVFDALQFAENSVSIEVARSEEYSALKNREGDNSPRSVARDLCNEYGRWLEMCGYKIPRNSLGDVSISLEISPLFAYDVQKLQAVGPKVGRIDNGLYLE